MRVRIIALLVGLSLVVMGASATVEINLAQGFDQDVPTPTLTPTIIPIVVMTPPISAQPSVQPTFINGKQYAIGDPGKFLEAASAGARKTADGMTARRTLRGSTGPSKPGVWQYGVMPPDRPYVRWYPAARWGRSISSAAYYTAPTPQATSTYSSAPTYHAILTPAATYPIAAPTADPGIFVTPTTSSEAVGPSVATDPRIMSFPYNLRGARGSINDLTLYGGLDAYLDTHPPQYTGDDQRYYQDFINQPTQGPTIQALARSLQSQSGLNDDARAAISLIQQIPYDWPNYYAGTPKARYPYQVLYDNTGVCGEKSILLASLLKELGYGVALLKFGPENHMAVGIRSPAQYAYKGTGYAFVETANATIPTDAEEGYGSQGSIKLSSTPTVFPIAEGNMFSTINEEVADAAEFRALQALGNSRDMTQYKRLMSLRAKYGM